MLGLAVKNAEGEGHFSHCMRTDRTGPVRSAALFFFNIFKKWLITLIAPNKTKPYISVQGYYGNWPLFLFFSAVGLSVRVMHAPSCFTAHALFRWRVRCPTVAGNEIPPCISMRLRVVFLPRWRVCHKNVRRRVDGRLKRRPRFSLSPARKSAGESPILW